MPTEDSSIKNPIIWAVEEGDYSDYHIVGVFSTKENAELAASRLKGSEVVEWTLDPAVDKMRSGLNRYMVVMLRDGTTERVEVMGLDPEEKTNYWRRKCGHNPSLDRPSCIRAEVWAKDETHAVKIANEKRAQMIAMNEWPCD